MLDYLLQGIAWGSVYGLIALGYTMVYGVLRLINFAHGDVVMVGAYLGWFALASWQLPFLSALPVAMIGCALLGLLMERTAYRPLRSRPRMTMLITAIGVSLLLEYGGQLVLGATPRSFPTSPFQATRLFGWLAAADGGIHRALGVGIGPVRLLILVSSAILMGALWLFVNRTRLGRAMRAVAFDRQTASLMGINTDRIISLTFLIGSALAGAAGVLVALDQPQIDPIMGLAPGIKAFVAAVLGGIGNIPGAMLGGVVMGVAEYLVGGYLASLSPNLSFFSRYQDAIAFALLIVVLLVKPTGITGKGAVEKV